MAMNALLEEHPTSAKEIVESLPAGMKRAVLCALLKELAEENAENVSVEIADEDGETVGIVMLPDDASIEADRMWGQIDALSRSALMKPYYDFPWDDVLSEAELTAIGLPRQPPDGKPLTEEQLKAYGWPPVRQVLSPG